MEIGDWLTQRLLGGGKTAHPFATKNGIADFLTMLPASQPALVVTYACDELEAAAVATPGLEPKVYRAALCEIDAGVQTAVTELGNMLFRDTRGELISHVSLKALTDYSTRIGALYSAVLEAPPWKDMTKGDKQSMALMACRGMIAARRRKKLARISYRAPELEQWQAVAALYARAHAFGVTRAALEAYSEERRYTSVHAEFVAALMLETAPLGSLNPTQIECLDLMIRHFATDLVIADRASAGAPFFVDMAHLQAPQRWLEGMPARPTLRFLGPGIAYGKVHGLAKEAKGQDQLPDWAAASDCDMVGYRRLMEILCEHWSSKPPQRRHRRTVESNELMLVQGFAQTRRMIAISEYVQSGKVPPEYSDDEVFTQKFFENIRFGSVDPSEANAGKPLKKKILTPRQLLEKLEMSGDRQLMNRSRLVDTSESGLSVALPSRQSWAKLGVLVGFRAHDGLDWEVTIIRRLGRAGGQLSLGLERLRGKTFSARAQPVMDLQAARDAVMDIQNSSDAILVSGETTLLIVPLEHVAAEQMLALWTQAGSRVLRVGTSLETGRDFRTMAVQYLD